MPIRDSRVALAVLAGTLGLLSLTVHPGAAQAPDAADACARVWLTDGSRYEDFLRAAQVTGLKEVPVGVTRPSRAFFTPGGLADSMAWKPIRPGLRNGYWESYKSEVAAYELDKLLALGMVPPTVERQVRGETGAGILWIAPTRSFRDMGGVPGQGGVSGPPPARLADWNRQMVRAKMFDNLIANKDPNLGNWLVDEDWHLILIDHSRAFTTMRNMVHEMGRVDQELWDRIRALDEPTLTAALGRWLGRREIRAILERRTAMEKDVASYLARVGV